MAQAANATSPDQIIDSWLELWNGDYGKADRLISSDFRVHAAMLDGSADGEITGPQGLVGWISLIRAIIPDLHFRIEVGPIVQDDHCVVRWSADGSYAGGYPGAGATIGTPVAFTGTDVLRVDNGQLAEYWLNSDMHVLLAQLQVTSG